MLRLLAAPMAIVLAVVVPVLGMRVSAAGDAAVPDAAPVAAGSWAWPVAAPHPIARAFIAPASRYGPGHRGVDVSAPTSTVGALAVTAPADGVVHFAGVVVDRPVLSIEHADGVLSSYEPVTTTLAEGAVVQRGDVIGTLQPGHCSSPCLHFGVRVDGEYVSPLLYLGGVPRAVLLPTRLVAGALAPAAVLRDPGIRALVKGPLVSGALVSGALVRQARGWARA